MGFAITNRFINPWVSFLLRSPLHPLLSGSLVLVTYRGRRSDREHTLPVQYAEDGREMVIPVGSPEKKRWWKNLRPDAPVRVLRRGRSIDARAFVLEEDGDRMASRLNVYFERFPGAARNR